MSYTGTEANLLERSLGSQVRPRMYPLESVASVTSAAKAQLTTLQSSELESRTEYGVHMAEPTEQPALPMEVSGVHSLSEPEREARSSQSVRKQEECPTTEENTHIRLRIKLSTQAATTVQARPGMNSPCIHVNNTLPVTESARIQHQSQVHPRRTLVVHGKGSTENFSHVPDTEEMAASLEKVPAKASLLTTSWGDHRR
jgi:hypothetical protein